MSTPTKLMACIKKISGQGWDSPSHIRYNASENSINFVTGWAEFSKADNNSYYRGAINRCLGECKMKAKKITVDMSDPNIDIEITIQLLPVKKKK